MKDLSEMVHTKVAGTFIAEKDELFYFGDICYIMKDQIYDKFWGDQKNYKDGIYEIPQGFFAVHGTAYGDGEYRGSGSLLRSYGVDAGVLGLVSGQLMDSIKHAEAKQHKLGAFFKVLKGQKIEFNFDKGEFEFRLFDAAGKTILSEYIDTKYGGDQEEDDEQGDYDDDDDGTADYDEVDESIQVTEEFEIEGVIVEKGDKIRVKEAFVTTTKDGLLNWVLERIAQGKKATWINWQSLPDGGFSGQMSPANLRGFKTKVDHFDRIDITNGHDQFLFALNYIKRFGIREEADQIHLSNDAVLISINFG